MNLFMEDAFIIQGGIPLKGEVDLSGAKNVALKVIISALMFDGDVILENIPRINDVFELLHLIRLIGAKAEFTGQNIVTVNANGIHTNIVDLLHGSKIRVSFMLAAPLLYRFQTCKIPNPGGCRIGARPIDRIIQGMSTLGITVSYDSESGYYQITMNKAPQGTYKFEKPSHTGTELLVLIALMGKDTITIENAALEPEIDNLIQFLNESGADIRKNKKDIIVHGAKSLRQNKPYKIITDRNEAITYATLALATKGDVTIKHIPKYCISTFIEYVQKSGASVREIDQQSFRFSSVYELISTSVETQPYPGFMTDWQPNWAVLMTQAKGESVLHERVFENRFSYVEELRKLGADIEYIKIPVKNPMEYFFFNFDPSKKYNQAIKVKGPQKLHGGVITIADLRAGATLAIAAFVAEGESIVNGVSIMERGYEDFVKKTKQLGAHIKKA